jgi:hypothetical protein
MTLGLKRHTSRLSALTLSATLALGVALPSFAQDTPESTPAVDTSSEIATQLPPVDLPTMNQQGLVFELESTFTGSLDSVPAEAKVYAMQFPELDADGAKSTAEKLGIDGDVEDQGGGTFAASGDGGNLFVTPGLTQFISSQEIPEGDLPSNDEAIAFAREWLRQVGMLPGNVGSGAVETRVETPPRIIVSFKPVQPAPILSAYPSITVTLGPQGSILEVSLRWASLSEGDTYQLRGGEQALAEVQGKRSYLETSLPPDLFDAGATVTGAATYSEVSIAYTSSGIPGEAQYLQPVYVFKGKVTPEGSEESFSITSYVPALINSQQPVG